MSQVEVVLKCVYGPHQPGERVQLTQDELAQLPAGWYERVEKQEFTPALRESARQAFEALRRVRELHATLNPGLMSDPFREALNGLRTGTAVHTAIGVVSLSWPAEYSGRSDQLDAVQAAVPEHKGSDGLIRPRAINYYRNADELIADLQAWKAEAGPVETLIERLAVKASEAQAILEAALDRKRRWAL